jgi:hypothetical protein
MNFIRPFTFALMTVSACTSVWFVGAIKPAGAGAFLFFAGWLILPYAVLLGALIFLAPKSGSSLHWFVVAALISVAGILLLSDVIFWHKDAQGAIAILMVPIVQGAAYVVLLPIAIWLSRHVRR